MTRQTRTSDLDTLSPSLRAKLQQLADGLTAEDEAQLSAMRRTARTSDLSPSLRAKGEQAAGRLTAEETAQLRRLFERTAVGAATGEEDTRGQMIKEPRVQPMPEGTGGGGGLKLQHVVNLIGLVSFVGGLLQGPAGLGGPAPEPGEP